MKTWVRLILVLLTSGGASLASRGAERAAGLKPAAARHEILALREEIARLDARYHHDDAPEISDFDYDQLKERLRVLERAFPAAAAEGTPVAEIGDDRSGRFKTQRHREKMLSLEKVHTERDLRAFHARLAKGAGRSDFEYVIEPKFDGFAVSLTYERGKLTRAVTRGNGLEGDDVTANVVAIPGVPREIKVESGRPALPELIELRAEVFVAFADFARVNAEQDVAGEPMFANPRNLAAGTIRQLDAREVTRRGLQLVFYGVGACLPESARPGSQRTFHALLERWRLPRMERHWTARGADELWSVVQVLGRERAKWEFPTDGVVVKADAVELQRKVGTAENAPRWAIAYKFAPERIETEVLAITVQIGRTGALTPVAELAPVELAGSKVTRATLHNRAEIARRDVRVGDWVIIEKAGEIVPAIVAVNVARRPSGTSAFEFPETCPVCRTPVAEVPGGTTVRCPNFTCLAQVRRRLEHFASKECLDIKGLGPAMIGSLVNHGWVRDVPDLYRLRREDLLTIGKDVEKTVDRLLAEIEASKRAELWRVVHGLGVPQVGAAAAKDVARRFGSLEALVAATPNDLGRDAAGKAMGRFLADENGRKLIGGLIDAGVGAAPPARE